LVGRIGAASEWLTRPGKIYGAPDPDAVVDVCAAINMKLLSDLVSKAITDEVLIGMTDLVLRGLLEDLKRRESIRDMLTSGNVTLHQSYGPLVGVDFLASAFRDTTSRSSELCSNIHVPSHAFLTASYHDVHEGEIKEFRIIASVGAGDPIANGLDMINNLVPKTVGQFDQRGAFRTENEKISNMLFGLPLHGSLMRVFKFRKDSVWVQLEGGHLPDAQRADLLNNNLWVNSIHVSLDPMLVELLMFASLTDTRGYSLNSYNCQHQALKLASLLKNGVKPAWLTTDMIARVFHSYLLDSKFANVRNLGDLRTYLLLIFATN
jgi:hypothetical protein